MSFKPLIRGRDLLTYFSFLTNVGVRGNFGIYGTNAHTWVGNILSPCCNGNIDVVSLRTSHVDMNEVTSWPTCSTCFKRVLAQSKNTFNDVESPQAMVPGMDDFLKQTQDPLASQILAGALAVRLELFTETYSDGVAAVKGRGMRHYAEHLTTLQRNICDDLSKALIPE